jgi:nucleotide exchange factor SIL1
MACPLATISLIFLLSALCGLYSATSNDDDVSVDLADDDEPDMFVPTREWQKVGKNTLLPSGLHIRINLETGEKEAKLPDDENLVQEEEAVQEVDRFKDRRRLKNYGHSDRSGIVNKKTAVFTKHEFRNVLRGSNVDVDESNTDELKLISHSAGSQSNTESHAGLSSPDSLAADDKPVQFEGKFLTKEQQLMLGCFDALHDTQSSEKTINTNLEELEYFVHSIENGEFFATTGGLSLMLTFLNHTNSAMRSLAAQVIGSAVQSNPRVQKQALQLGVLEALLPGLSYHKSDLEQRRSLYALSNFLRRYFPAQEKFIVQLSGFDAIIDHSKDKSLKFQLKAVVILTDMLNESFEDSSGEKESMMG